jgi:hypothetical protein
MTEIGGDIKNYRDVLKVKKLQKSIQKRAHFWAAGP